MTITDVFLNETAKWINDESTTTPGYLGVATTEVNSVLSTATELDGEIGSRTSLTKTRSQATTSMSAIRSGASVINTADGDALESSGTFSASSSGNFFTGVPHSGILQKTSFDLEFVTDVTARRV